MMRAPRSCSPARNQAKLEQHLLHQTPHQTCHHLCSSWHQPQLEHLEVVALASLNRLDGD